jgi:hypothetical protein
MGPEEAAARLRPRWAVPEIGTSYWLERAFDSVTETELANASGMESETGVRLAGLQRLLGPFIGAPDALPSSARIECP